MCKHLLKIQRLILALLIFGGGIFYTSSAPARVCFLPDSTDCGEGDVDVPEVQVTCATYGGYEAPEACLADLKDKTAQTCILNSGCYYPKCAYDSERNCKNANSDKNCLSQDVDGVKCWYAQAKTCSEQGYKNTPCTTDEDSGTVPNTLEASDGPCYKCTEKATCKQMKPGVYYGPNDTCPKYTDRKDAGVSARDGVCSTCEPQACSAINTAYKNAANQNTCGSDKVATPVAGTDSAADGPCYTCENTDACTYKYGHLTLDDDTHGDSILTEQLYRSFQYHAGNTEGASYYWNGSGSRDHYNIDDASGYQIYSKIDKNSKSCQKGNKTAYETICPGTAKGFCEKSKRKFVPNGCSSEPYVVGRLTVVGMEFGACGCDTSKRLYDTEAACRDANSGAKSLECTPYDRWCYQTCEDAGMYSSEDACKTNAPKYTKCNFNGSCYIRSKLGWGFHYTHGLEKSDRRRYKCTSIYPLRLPDKGYSPWTASVSVEKSRNEHFINWEDAKDLIGDTYERIEDQKGEVRYPAGEYRICVNHGLPVASFYIAKTNGDACAYRSGDNDDQWHADENNKEFCSNINPNEVSGGYSKCLVATFEDDEEYYVHASMKSIDNYNCYQVDSAFN